MKGALALRKPVLTTSFSSATTNIPTGSWITLLAATSVTKGCSAIEFYNGTSSLLTLASGTAGNEVAFPFTIFPGAASGPVLIPIELQKGVRLALQTADGTTASTGYFGMNLFQ